MFLFVFRQTSRLGTLHSRPKQCKHVLDFSWNPSWNLLEICWVKFVDTLEDAVADFSILIKLTTHSFWVHVKLSHHIISYLKLIVVLLSVRLRRRWELPATCWSSLKTATTFHSALLVRHFSICTVQLLYRASKSVPCKLFVYCTWLILHAHCR